MLPDIITLRKTIEIAQKKMRAIQDKCLHEHFTHSPKSNTGNFDPSDDCYWVEVDCLVCGKHFSVDYEKDPEGYRKYCK